MADAQSTQFDSTLLSFGPPGTYNLTSLSGGLINETVRASCKHGSFIMKYAPPYIAAIGPSAPFGRERQIVEAAALSLFTPWLDGKLAYITYSAEAFVPFSLLHDKENHVIRLTDFGDSISLTRFLNARTPQPVHLEHAAEIGTRLGHFFGKLHSPSVFQLIHASSAGKSLLENSSSGRSLVREMVVKPQESMMMQFNVPAGEAKKLAEAITRNWDEAERQPNTAFVLGDSWTGSVLLRTETADQEELKLAVIDWEFASFASSGVSSDVATMLAHIKLRSIAARVGGNESVAKACSVLGRDMCKSYRTISIDEVAPWTQHLRNQNQDVGWEELARVVCMVVGRDMVHNASELEWDCACCESKGGRDECQLKFMMVCVGVEFLKAGIVSTDSELRDFVLRDEMLRRLLERAAKISGS